MKRLVYLVSVFAVWANSEQLQAEKYQIVDLGIKPASSPSISINNFGVIAGNGYNPNITSPYSSEGRDTIFRYDSGTVDFLETLSGGGTTWDLAKLGGGIIRFSLTTSTNSPYYGSVDFAGISDGGAIFGNSSLGAFRYDSGVNAPLIYQTWQAEAMPPETASKAQVGGVNSGGVSAVKTPTDQGSLYSRVLVVSEETVKTLPNVSDYVTAGPIVSENGSVIWQAKRSTWSVAVMSPESDAPVYLDPPTGMAYRAYDVNAEGAMVGAQSSDANTSVIGSTAMKWSNTLQLTVLQAPTNALGAVAYGINDAGRVVGAVNIVFQNQAVVSEGNSLVNLNGLVPQGSGWSLQKAISVNNAGQIVGIGTLAGQSRYFLLNPVQAAATSYEAATPLPSAEPLIPQTGKPAVPHLSEWDRAANQFVPVAEHSISGGDVHVLVHGWAPGYQDDVVEYEATYGAAPDVWNQQFQTLERNNGATPYGLWYESMAEAMEYRYAHTPGHENDEVHILAFSWIDRSATSDALTQAVKSQAHTTEAGASLKSALLAAFGSEPFDGKVQLLGHSHGAKVATLAALSLNASGAINVDNLTLLDSPEIYLPGGLNNLNNLLRQLPATTFVDNYYSMLGTSYDAPNVTNVRLDPAQFDSSILGILGSLGARHSYAVNWYNEATIFTNNEGMSWFFSGPPAAKNLFQDWVQGGETDSQYEFRLLVLADVAVTGSTSDTTLSLTPYYTNGSVAQKISKRGGLLIDFTEHSPAYWQAMFTSEDGELTLEFYFQFLNAGDGDQLGVWIDDQLRFLVTGDTVGTEEQMGVVDISDLVPGMHFLTVALHNLGDTNAEFTVSDFQTVSIAAPEIPSVAFWATGLFWLGLRRGRDV